MDLMASYSQRRSGARNGARLAEAAIRSEKERQAAEQKANAEEAKARRKASREAQAATLPFTADELRHASHVHDGTAWHPVVRVSKKSVTVSTPYSWTERVPIERVSKYVVDGRYLFGRRPA